MRSEVAADLHRQAANSDWYAAGGEHPGAQLQPMGFQIREPYSTDPGWLFPRH